MTNSIPSGYHSVTPSLTLKNSKEALEFYKKAFGATVLQVFPNLNGHGIMHAVMKIGDSLVMMGDEMPGRSKSVETTGSSPISLFIYVPDADVAFAQAIAAGATVTMPVADMFWGDRAGNLKDPFGYQWMIASHKRDMTDAEIRTEAEIFFKSSAPSK